MPFPVFTAGQRLTASLLSAVLPITAIKTSDESVTSSTALQDDNELFVSVAAPATYLLGGFLMWVGNDTGDIKLAFTNPASSTMHWALTGPSAQDTAFASGATRGAGEWFPRNNQTSSPTSSIPYSGSTGLLHGRLVGSLTTSNAGTLRLQWAQNTSNGTATTVKLGSWISLRRIS